MASYSAKAAEALREQQSLTQCVRVMMETSRFAQRLYYNSGSHALPYPTNDTRLIMQAAVGIVDRLFVEGYAYSKTGVGLLDLSHGAQQAQGDLFGDAQPLASKALMKVMDAATANMATALCF